MKLLYWLELWLLRLGPIRHRQLVLIVILKRNQPNALNDITNYFEGLGLNIRFPKWNVQVQQLGQSEPLSSKSPEPIWIHIYVLKL